MVHELITEVRTAVTCGKFTKASLARKAGLHPNTLRDADKDNWSPNASTLMALEQLLFPEAGASDVSARASQDSDRSVSV